MALEIDTEGNAEAKNGLKRHDSLYGDAEKVSGVKHHGSEINWIRTLHLAFQSIGVIYGDIGTSPLYVYSSTFTDGIKDKEDLLGVLSLIIYSLIMIPMLKYVFVVLWANDNGDGGTIALYSLISRHAKVRMIPDQQAEDAMVSNYKIETPNSQLRRAQWIKQKLESSKAAKVALFMITILGTTMVMGDGTLTPAMSVLSAVSGIREKAPQLTQAQVVWISVAILFMLFSVQRFGTDKVGYSFAPIISLWFILLAGTGLYNLVTHEVSVLRAFNPKYIVDYFRRNGKQGWVSLGGVMLCITGTEAMFADLGHFSVRAVQISFTFVLFPSVALCYIGQAAYLWKYPENVGDTFYKSIPGPLFWPGFIVAILAAIIASQAMLSASFAILSKALSLGCFPRVRVVHTSKKYEGQVYIPEVNFLLGIASIAVTLGFKTTTNIGNAYGVAVLAVFLITTHLMTLVMLFIWKTNIVLVILFYVVFGSIEFTYMSSVLEKFIKGGFLPVCFSLVLMVLMASWHYVHVKKYWYELEHIVPSDNLKQLVEKHEIGRIPGVGLLYSELVQGIPPVFPRLVEKIPSIHSIFVFVSIKHLPIPHVLPTERFIFRQVGTKDMRMFRCVARYGYVDVLQDSKEFAAFLIERLKIYVEEETFFAQIEAPTESELNPNIGTDGQMRPRRSAHSTIHIEETLRTDQESTEAIQSHRVSSHSGRIDLDRIQAAEEEKQFIDKEMERGVVYLLGEAEVIAAPESSFIKKIAVNYIYTFLRKNLRGGDKALSIPKNQLLKVGITYEI